jgi:hypothetical protein
MNMLLPRSIISLCGIVFCESGAVLQVCIGDRVLGVGAALAAKRKRFLLQ